VAAACGEFLATDPYVVGTKRAPETRRLIYYVVKAVPPPIDISLITGDAIQNLMSASDHLAHQLVCVGTGHDRPFPTFTFQSEMMSRSDLLVTII
jgi:hypothetical protein